MVKYSIIHFAYLCTYKLHHIKKHYEETFTYNSRCLGNS